MYVCTSDRRSEESHWSHLTSTVHGPLHRAFAGRFPAAEIERVTGAAEVNNYEIYNPGDYGHRGLFPVTSLLSHSCAPNARQAMRRTGQNKCVAAVEIKKVGKKLSRIVRTTLIDNITMCCSLSFPFNKINILKFKWCKTNSKISP